MEINKYKGQNAVPKSGQIDGPVEGGGETNPQNYYRSYSGNGSPVSEDVNSQIVSHAKLTHEEMIDRANGGEPGYEPISKVGKFVADGE